MEPAEQRPTAVPGESDTTSGPSCHTATRPSTDSPLTCPFRPSPGCAPAEITSMRHMQPPSTDAVRRTTGGHNQPDAVDLRGLACDCADNPPPACLRGGGDGCRPCRVARCGRHGPAGSVGGRVRPSRSGDGVDRVQGCPRRGRLRVAGPRLALGGVASPRQPRRSRSCCRACPVHPSGILPGIAGYAVTSVVARPGRRIGRTRATGLGELKVARPLARQAAASTA